LRAAKTATHPLLLALPAKEPRLSPGGELIAANNAAAKFQSRR
jgi:hypothetical protein